MFFSQLVNESISGMNTTIHLIRTRCGIMALVVLAWLVQIQPATAVSILFHGDTTSAPNDDQAMQDYLNARYGAGSVTYMQSPDAALDGSSADGFDMIFISESSVSSDLRGKYEDSPVPVFNSESALDQTEDGDFQMSTSTTFPSGQSNLFIPPSAEGHFLAAGLSGTVQVFDSPQNTSFSNSDLGADVFVIAEQVEDPLSSDSYGIIAVETGGALLGDGFNTQPNTSPATATARRVNFFLWRVGFSHLTADGIKLFDASTDWALGLDLVEDGDFDDDGDVDGADFLLWQRDPSVGELATWQSQFGEVGSGAAATAVPEPGSALLLGLACALLGIKRCKK